MLWSLLSSGVQVRRAECSDVCRPLIHLWQIVRDDPKSLTQRYAEMRRRFVAEGKDYFYAVRAEFNRTENPYLFLFLSRTCRLGHVRFNERGQFNTPVHHSHYGIDPIRLEAIVDSWHRKLSASSVCFSRRDYRRVRSRPGDLLYLDPPYKTRQCIYGRMHFPDFFKWLSKQEGGYLLSLNGFLGEQDNTVEVPPSLFDQHIQLDAGSNSQLRLGHRVVQAVTDTNDLPRDRKAA
jgi:DNA adenine methylase